MVLSYFLLPPELVKERIKLIKEGMKRWDKIYAIVSAPFSFSMFIISVLDGGRFCWEPRIPVSIVVIGIVVFSIGQTIVLWAKKVNRFFFTVVCIEKGQTVCKDGPYRFVRHPGYLGGSLYLIATPIVLGSFWGLFPAAVCVFLVIVRTYLEDKTLQAELPGYIDYTKEVKYKLLPKIW
ncbi:MAG: methyltransferase family protein [Candidatus Asgardarchaeia archaeon]